MRFQIVAPCRGLLRVSKRDSISSTRRLGALVGQIVKTVGWDKRFSCHGIENLREFRAVLREFDAMAPGFYPPRYEDVWDFIAKMDSLLNLLNATEEPLLKAWNTKLYYIQKRQAVD